ncbi:tyrosine-type recombinase/integrase [Enterococcus sp. AZ126]|uniref:tyrosine-type recombinase/integrase n=1 Tax=Enterococcus sp. AZ126 TaxID=2774635 RepID=UPI003F1FDB5D
MAKGENIYKRKDGRWEGRYPKARKKDGSIYYGYIYGKSYQVIRKQLIEKKAAYASYHTSVHQQFQGDFNAWATIWLNQLMKEEIKESTYASYKNKFSQHILPVIGHLLLNQVTKESLDELVQKMKGTLSPSSIQVIFRLVKSCLKSAKEHGYLYTNPAELISLPKIQKKELSALTRKQQAQLIKVVQQSMNYLPILLALETGMRIGEISALKWSDIDFEQELIHVRRTQQRILDYTGGRHKTKIIETSPKTMRASRVIPMSSLLKIQLNKARRQSSSPYVVGKHGKALEPRTITYRFTQLRKTIGLPNVGFHVLRHTFATRCLEVGVSIHTISALLGHTSIKMTLDTYTHSCIDDQRLAMKKLAILL